MRRYRTLRAVYCPVHIKWEKEEQLQYRKYLYDIPVPGSVQQVHTSSVPENGYRTVGNEKLPLCGVQISN